MASRQNQFILEKMVPEFIAYKRSKVLQPDEVDKLIRRRKVFEEKINADLPPLKLFLQYITHLHATHELVVDRWLKLGNSREELFEEANNVYSRINGVVDLTLRRYRGNPDAWQAVLEILGQIKLYDKRATIAQTYLELFPSEAEPWILAAQIAEESEGVAHARSVYQQAAKCIGLQKGVMSSNHYHGVGRTGIANTADNKRTVDIAIRRKLDAVRASTDSRVMQSPWKKYSTLIINWALFEVRHVAALRGKHGEANYMSDYLIDKQLDGSLHMRRVLQGELVALVLKRGIIAALSVSRLAHIPDNLEFSLLLAYEHGKLPYLAHAVEYRAACSADVDRVLSSPVAESFIKEVYEAVDTVCTQLKWVPWWTSRVINLAIQMTVGTLQKALETDELSVLKNYQVEKNKERAEALKDMLAHPKDGDYGMDPLKDETTTISQNDIDKLKEAVSAAISKTGGEGIQI